MRVHRWLAPILGVLLILSSGRDTNAQYPPEQGRADYQSWSANGSWVPAPVYDHASYVVPTGSAAYVSAPAGAGIVEPGYSTLSNAPYGQAAFVPGMTAWPGISGFDHNYSRHYQDNGLWLHDFNSRGRQYFSRFEYIKFRSRNPKGLIGQRGAQSYAFVVANSSGDTLDIDDLLDQFVGDVDRRDLPAGVFPADGSRGFNYYDGQNANVIRDPRSNGIRLKWGFTEPDDSGLIIDGWWSGYKSAVFDAEKGLSTRRLEDISLVRKIIDDPNGFLFMPLPFESFSILEQNLLNLGGLPIDDGTFQVLADGTNLGGTTIPYDLEFKFRYMTESAGTSLSWLLSPLVKTSNFKLNAMVGARYMYLNETFRFDGEDSGLSYDTQDDDGTVFPRVKVHSLPNGFDDDGDGTIDNAGLIEDQIAQTGMGMGRFVRNDLVADIIGVEHPGRYSAFIENGLTSHLAGPELGLQFDVGGDKFRITGHSKFALLINNERLKLRGDNIGEGNNIGNNIDPDNAPDFMGDDDGSFFIQDSPLITPTLANPNPNAFADRTKHTHVSPAFEQSITAHVPIVEYIPFLNRIHVLEDATVVFGYTYMFVSEVTRPTQSIRFQGNPRAGLFPSLNLTRGTWHSSMINVGLDIPY